MEKIACYCQNCRAANNLGETKCRSCGTRLLLVVFPQSLKFDTNHVPSYYEDHLLERVTLLELRVAQLSEQLAMAYEIIRRETKQFQKNRRKSNDLVEVSEETLALQNENLSNVETKKQKLNENQKNVLEKIISAHGKTQTELFAHLMKESFRLLEENEEKQAFQTLKQAASISRDNPPLNFFIAENLFRLDKFAEAKIYLENLFESDAQNEKVLLLLGVVYADQKQIEKARKLLSVLAEKPLTVVLVNYIWGMLAAFEENWTESLAAFKQCLRTAKTPVINYLIGCVYYQIEDYKKALRYFEKAVIEDEKFADAWFMKAAAHKKLKDFENANESNIAAFKCQEAGAQCLVFLKNRQPTDLQTALPFLHFTINKNLLTKGSLRLNKFLRESVFDSFA